MLILVFGQISGRTRPKRDEAGHNSSHLKTFRVKTRDTILIKVSKTSIFAYYAYFSAIFGHISGTPDHFRPFNTISDEE